MFNKGSFFIPSWQAPFFFESPSHSLFIARIYPAIIARFSVRANPEIFSFLSGASPRSFPVHASVRLSESRRFGFTVNLEHLRETGIRKNTPFFIQKNLKRS
jgi:hypothetical protein